MNQDEAIELAWAVVRGAPVAKAVEGVQSARLISPARTLKELLAQGASQSQIPAFLKEDGDYWIVLFKLIDPPGLKAIPDAISVRVDDRTGAAEFR